MADHNSTAPMEKNEVEKIISQFVFDENEKIQIEITECGGMDWYDPVQSLKIENGILIIDNSYAIYETPIEHIKEIKFLKLI